MLLRDCRGRKDCDRSDPKEINGISQAQRSVVCEKEKSNICTFSSLKLYTFQCCFAIIAKRQRSAEGEPVGFVRKTSAVTFICCNLKNVKDFKIIRMLETKTVS